MGCEQNVVSARDKLDEQKVKDQSISTNCRHGCIAYSPQAIVKMFRLDLQSFLLPIFANFSLLRHFVHLQLLILGEVQVVSYSTTYIKP